MILAGAALLVGVVVLRHNANATTSAKNEVAATAAANLEAAGGAGSGGVGAGSGAAGAAITSAGSAGASGGASSGGAGGSAGASGGHLTGGSSNAAPFVAAPVERSGGPAPAGSGSPAGGLPPGSPSSDTAPVEGTPKQTAPPGPGSKPTAAEDAFTVEAGTTVVLDPLANDTDPDGDLDPGSLVIVTRPQFGPATSIGDGTIRYSPESIYRGSDTLTYFICDARQNCTGAIVHLTVVDPAAAPDPAAPTTAPTVAPSEGTPPPLHS